MFEAAEVGRNISKQEYKQRVPGLRQALLEIQQQLRQQDFPVIIVFAGVDGAGKGDTVNLLNSWMDPRWLITHAYTEPSQEEKERPEYWRYWRDLPSAGKIGMFLSSWYSHPILERVYGKITLEEFDRQLDRIAAFENALAADGALILKFWMHLSHAEQEKRLTTLEKDPLQTWRVNDADWKHWHMYDEFIRTAEHAIVKTSNGNALWQMVEGADQPYRSLTVGQAVLDGIGKQLARRQAQKAADKVLRQSQQQMPANCLASGSAKHTALSLLDTSKKHDKKRYQEHLKHQQARLNQLHREALKQGVSTLMVFEGPDAAGKGGAIRRCTAALDARHYEVIPFAAPTDEEKRHHYLWRFWRRLGRAGRVSIFDRSWYGRVLVERVEGFATEDQWSRAYGEINDFESQLVQYGIVLVKYWIHVTPEEQLKRFKEREEIPWKQWKLTEEDWRNREKWPLYEQAVNDMLAHTSTSLAPWTLVEGNNKRYARVKVLDELCGRLETALGFAPS